MKNDIRKIGTSFDGPDSTFTKKTYENTVTTYMINTKIWINMKPKNWLDFLMKVFQVKEQEEFQEFNLDLIKIKLKD